MVLAGVGAEARAQVLELGHILQVLVVALDGRSENLLLFDLGLYSSLLREGPCEALLFLALVNLAVMDFDAASRGAG